MSRDSPYTCHWCGLQWPYKDGFPSEAKPKWKIKPVYITTGDSWFSMCFCSPQCMVKNINKYGNNIAEGWDG